MRVWPVVLVWDSALETRDYEKVENCLFERVRTFKTFYSLVPDVEIIRFSLGAEGQTRMSSPTLSVGIVATEKSSSLWHKTMGT